MPGHPLEVLQKIDPQLFGMVEQSSGFALGDGALSRKHKLLIAMALDAAHGAAAGVRALAGQAREAGATDQEIVEAIRVAHYVCGVGSVYTAANGLRDLF